MRKFTLSLTLSVGIALVGCATLTPTPGTSPSLVSPAYEPGDLVVNLKIRGSRTVQDAPDVVAIYSAEDVKKLEILPMLKVGEGDYRPLGKTGGTTSEGSADQLKQVIETPDGIPQIVLKNLAPNSTYRIRVRAFDAQDRLISKDAQSVSADVTLTNFPVLPRADVPLHLEDKTFETTARAYVGFEAGRGASTQVRLTLLKKVGSDPEVPVGQPLVLDASTFPRAIDLGRLGPNATYALKAEALDANEIALIEDRVEWGVGNDRTLAAKNLMLNFEPIVSTLSGSTVGYIANIVEDEPLAQARYNMPSGMTLGADGAVYLADHENRRIRRLDLVADKVSTWATLSHKPIMLTKSPDGSLYATSTDWISNESVSRLYRITAKDTHGYYPGVGPGEQIIYLSGVCLDPQGNLYVSASNAIWRYSAPNQLWEKIATFGPGTNFTSLVATQDALYATVYASSRIYRISLGGQGNVETFAGSDTPAIQDGPVATAQLQSPRSLALSGDTLYFSDNGRIRRIKDGMVKTIAGGAPGAPYVPPANGKGSEASFSSYIDGLLVLPDGDLLVSDSFNYCIRKITFFKETVN